MVGSFITRGLVMVFGYAYPAYECYKTVEMNKPEIEQLIFWCQYWILVALMTAFERIGDAFVSWIPMYSEAKLAFFIYLWYPKTKGTTYIYDSFFRPYVAKHEIEIDRNLLELRTRAGDMAVLYCQRAASYGQTRIFEILQFVASQSTPSPRPAQPKQVGAGARQPPAASNHQPTTARQLQTEEPPSPTSSSSSREHQKEVAEEARSPQVPKAVLPPAALTAKKATVASLTTSKSMPTEGETKDLEAVPSSANENVKSPPKETIMEESIRVTRGRLRKARSAGNR